MIFKNKSSYMLKYEQTKSKLIEFDIEKKNYPVFPMNSDDLTYSTIYALSRYCELLIEKGESSKLNILFDSLKVVSQYFDATVKTNKRQFYNNTFLLLGATAYFMSENFGSAKVLIVKIEEWQFEDDIISLLYVTLYYLLIGQWKKVSFTRQTYVLYIQNLEKYFQTGDKSANVFSVLDRIQKAVYCETNVPDLNYVDFLYAVIIRAMEHSSWNLLSKKSLVGIEKWTEYLAKPDSVKLLWPAQKVIIEAGALIGKNLVVPLPTGVGKTKSIEIILQSNFLKGQKSICFIIVPLRALCNEIVSELINAFDDEVEINQFSDTLQEDFDLETRFNKMSVFVCTPEKFTYVLRHRPDLLDTISLFIFDEAHLFDDESRGAQYELLISEIVRNRNKTAQIILFSAVLSNASQIGDWLFNDDTATIDYNLVKSTDKSIGFVSSDRAIHYYQNEDMDEESFFIPKSVLSESLSLNKRERKTREFPEENQKDMAIYYANKLCINGGVAIYAGQARSIGPIMKRIIELKDRDYDLNNLLTKSNNDEIKKIKNHIAVSYGDTSELTNAAALGAFPHYAYLPNGTKLSIEHALRKSHIRFIVCTTTLAEGVNIPIKYLFLTTFSQGTSNVQVRKIQNLVGRTARSGVYTEGSAIITDPKYFDERNDRKHGGIYRWNDCKKMFDPENAEACGSAILALVRPFEVDYLFSLKKNDIANYLLSNYNMPAWFENMQKQIKEQYRDTLKEKQSKTFENVIDYKTQQIKNIIENIESYLCYIYDSINNATLFFDYVTNLTKNTFAFYLGNDEEKANLISIFQLIAQRITVEIKPENAKYYSKSMFGIDISNQIVEWLLKEFDSMKGYSEDQILFEAIELMSILFSNNSGVDSGTLYRITNMWVEGKSYIEIYNKLKNFDVNIKFSEVEKICNKEISYHLSYFIGNIHDAISEQFEPADELTDKLFLLQKKIKYGVPNKFQIQICDNIFYDRIVADEIDKLLGERLIPDKGFKKYIGSNKKKIQKILKEYPDYFICKFNTYVG